jgi:GNAT superfamily N-acetyltransferase
MTYEVRIADRSDAPDIARLLHAFNSEFETEVPPVDFIESRVSELIEDGDIEVLLIGDGPDGLAMTRLRRPWWSEGLDAYLEELYVEPALRGEGRGRALLDEAIERARDAGAVHIDLGTGEGDSAARALYESAGFTNVEDGTDDDRMLYYERDL